MLQAVRWFSNGKLMVISYDVNLRNAGFHGTKEECENHVEMLKEIASQKGMKVKFQKGNELV